MQRDSYTTIAVIHAPVAVMHAPVAVMHAPVSVMHAPVSVIPAKAGIHSRMDSRLRGNDGVPAGMSGYDRA